MATKKILRFTFICIMMLAGFLTIGNRTIENLSGADTTLEDTFTTNGDLFHTDITTAVNPSVVHVLLNFTTVSEVTISLSVYNITAGNNTQIWTSGQPAFTERFEKSIHLNITVESTQAGMYTAPFKLLIHENEIELLTDEEDYIWNETFFASGDFNYLDFTYTELTIVKIHTQLDVTGLPDFELHTKASPDYYEDWMYAEGPEEEETHLTFQANPGDIWTLYFELIGDPTNFPMNFTVTISTTDRIVVDSTTEEYSGYYTEENPISLYEITITEEPVTLRWNYVADYYLMIDIYNDTDELYHDFDEGDSLTFDTIDTYLFKVTWDTHFVGVKNNYTLRMQLGPIVVDLVPETMTTLDDNFFFGGDTPEYKINIPAGNYQLKIMEFGERSEWILNFTDGYSDGWKNFYYTVVIIVPPFPVQVHNWKAMTYSKLTNVSCSLDFVIDQFSTASDYNIGFIIREYDLPDDTVEENLEGVFYNTDDFDYYKINVEQESRLLLEYGTGVSGTMNVSVELLESDFELLGAWEFNSTSTSTYEPLLPGEYYIKIKSQQSTTQYSIRIEIQVITKKGNGLEFGVTMVSLLTIQFMVIVYKKKKSFK